MRSAIIITALFVVLVQGYDEFKPPRPRSEDCGDVKCMRYKRIKKTRKYECRRYKEIKWVVVQAPKVEFKLEKSKAAIEDYLKDNGYQNLVPYLVCELWNRDNGTVWMSSPLDLSIQNPAEPTNPDMFLRANKKLVYCVRRFKNGSQGKTKKLQRKFAKILIRDLGRIVGLCNAFYSFAPNSYFELWSFSMSDEELNLI